MKVGDAMEAQMQMILRAWLDRLKISVTKLAEQIQGESPTYRTLDVMSRRGTATLATAASAVDSLRRISGLDIKIDDIIIATNLDVNNYVSQRLSELQGNISQKIHQADKVIPESTEEIDRIIANLNEMLALDESNNEVKEKLITYINKRYTFNGNFVNCSQRFFTAKASDFEFVNVSLIHECVRIFSEKDELDALKNLMLLYTNPDFGMTNVTISEFAKSCSKNGLSELSLLLIDKI